MEFKSVVSMEALDRTPQRSKTRLNEIARIFPKTRCGHSVKVLGNKNMFKKKNEEPGHFDGFIVRAIFFTPTAEKLRMLPNNQDL